MAGKTALIIVASEGSEEMELAITSSILQLGGIKVTIAVAAHELTPVRCIRGLKVVPDAIVPDVTGTQFDLIVIPGGPGCENLAECPTIGQILQEQQGANGLIAAICSGPTVLKAHGIKAETMTAHHSVRKCIESGGDYKFSEDPVVVSGNVITSQGPGTAFSFALQLVALLDSQEKAKSLMDNLVLKCSKSSKCE